MLEVRNVDAGYDFLQVIWDVTFHVADGEFVALIGPNGAGKTTTLRTIAGLLTPLRGQVRFQNRPINSLPAHQTSRMGIGFVSETLNL
ncbi:MAG: ATP-binding cassette domain-containing protein, partial [Chloroflexota bacterium]